jgi:hypothetical protein
MRTFFQPRPKCRLERFPTSCGRGQRPKGASGTCRALQSCLVTPPLERLEGERFGSAAAKCPGHRHTTGRLCCLAAGGRWADEGGRSADTKSRPYRSYWRRHHSGFGGFHDSGQGGKVIVAGCCSLRILIGQRVGLRILRYAARPAEAQDALCGGDQWLVLNDLSDDRFLCRSYRLWNRVNGRIYGLHDRFSGTVWRRTFRRDFVGDSMLLLR